MKLISDRAYNLHIQLWLFRKLLNGNSSEKSIVIRDFFYELGKLLSKPISCRVCEVSVEYARHRCYKAAEGVTIRR